MPCLPLVWNSDKVTPTRGAEKIWNKTCALGIVAYVSNATIGASGTARAATSVSTVFRFPAKIATQSNMLVE